jgi:hypothetical protein
MTASDNPLFNSQTVAHALPTDPRETHAVVVAARRCYDLHPYFSMRYGSRGSVFARSDGGYLVTLVDQPQASVDEQVFWLAGFLAGKGMPRWLMEANLGCLYEALSAAVPEREADYLKLQHAASPLRAARQRWIPQADFDDLIAGFDASSQGWITSAGGLMGAAVCDECCGLDTAVPSLMSWMDDGSRFPPPWRRAANETLERARSIAARARAD